MTTTTNVPAQQSSTAALGLAEATLIGLFIAAEHSALTAISRVLQMTPPTFEGRIMAVHKMRAITRQILHALSVQVPPAINTLITTAQQNGEHTASVSSSNIVARIAKDNAGGGDGLPPSSDIGRLGEDWFGIGGHGLRSALAIQEDLRSSLDDVMARLTRLPDDVYKVIAPHAAIYQVLGDRNVTPAQAQAAAWKAFTSQGITGFTDRGGRNWSMSAYVEMAVRTASQRAFNESNISQLHSLGIHYFTVSDDGHPCPLCFPWQNKVLVDAERRPADTAMVVDGTIDDARAAGLFHPNCRHTLMPVLPGYTKLPDLGPWDDAMAAKYKATQQQRALELEVRKHKRAAAYVIDPEVRQAALKDVRRAQERIRLHLAANDHLNRRSRREQIDLAMDHQSMPKHD